MISIAWRTARARWAGFAGSFLAVALGVALSTNAGLALAAALAGPDDPPQWYVNPSVVVAGPDRAGAAPDGTQTGPPLPPGERGHVPSTVVAMISTVDGVAGFMVDHAGPAHWGTARTAHPWAASALHPYRLVSGSPPADDDQVVVPAGAGGGARPGEVIHVATLDGPQAFTVSGVIDSPAEPALYTTDTTAARLSRDRVAAVVLRPEPGTDLAALAGEVRAALAGYPGLRVLTGDDRRGAELDPQAGLLTAATSLLGSATALAVFVSAFVVAGTFAYTVAQRRREFALLRAAGATGRQVRRVVVGEALLVGGLAGLAGTGLGVVTAPASAGWLARNGLAPAGFTPQVTWWPLAIAFGIGLVVAVAGAWVAGRRAGRIRPAEALREVSVERRDMTLTRWVLGVASLGGAIPMAPLLSDPEGPAYLLVVVMLLVLGGALLLPVLMRPFARLLTIGRGPIALLARASTQSERRRYAATIAPVLITVGLAASAVAGIGTISAAEASGLRQQLTAPVLVVPAGEAPLPEQVAARAGAVPRVTAAALAKTTAAFDAPRGAPRQRTAWYADGPAAPQVLRLPMASGSFDDLTGDTVAVSASVADANGWRVGDRAELWLGDGALVDLAVVAVYDDRLGLPDVVLAWSLAATHATTPAPDAVYVAAAPGVDRDGLATIVAPLGGAVVDAETHLTTLDEQFDRLSRLALFAIVGIAVLYTGISIANTQLMAATAQQQELSILRMAGATRWQILRLVARQALTITGTGAASGLLVTAATLVAVHAALSPLSDAVPIQIPWLVILVVTACCGIIALTASLTPATFAVRHTHGR